MVSIYQKNPFYTSRVTLKNGTVFLVEYDTYCFNNNCLEFSVDKPEEKEPIATFPVNKLVSFYDIQPCIYVIREE